MNNSIIIPNIICVIIPNEVELNVTGKIINQILKIKNKPIKNVIIITRQQESVIDAITEWKYDYVRVFVISSQNINLLTELNEIKRRWPITINIYDDFFKQKDVYFVIDVVSCSINNLEDCCFKNCANIYSIKTTYLNDVKNNACKIICATI